MTFYVVMKTPDATQYLAHCKTLLQACDAAVMEAGNHWGADFQVWDHRGRVHMNHIQDINAYVKTMSEDTAKLHVLPNELPSLMRRQAS